MRKSYSVIYRGVTLYQGDNYQQALLAYRTAIGATFEVIVQ